MISTNILLVVSLVVFVVTNGHAQKYHDVVISEIMADPTPSAGLPEVEYLELLNRTSVPVSLKNWRLQLGTRFVTLPDSILAPESYTIVCHKNNVSAFKEFAPLIGLNSFALTNDRSILALYNQRNQLVYSVDFNLTQWPPDRRDGGHSLEMSDIENPCGAHENWSVSIDESGGTPGKANSVKLHITDTAPPAVDRADVVSDKKLTLIFNKRLDSLNAVLGATIEISGRRVINRKLESPGFQNLSLELDSPLLPGKTYKISVQNLSDCAGNILRDAFLNAGLPEEADSGDVVINEILFNPKENGVDYVEIYNRSGKYIGLKNWVLGNVKNGKIDNLINITKDDVVLSPNGYLALTTDSGILKEQYPSDKNGKFLIMNSLPSFPNTSGGVILQNDAGLILDHFLYFEEMHSPFVSDPKGVSLERIDPEKPGDDPGNWQSAASTSGHGTPGYTNSQSNFLQLENAFWVEPEAFMPLLNNSDNIAEIKYSQTQSGKIGSIRVFDINGRLVKNLIQNQLLGTTGNVKWDGTDSRGAIVRTGYYLILIETFDVNGNKNQYKKKVVVASQ